jgi:hypothetical protein
METSAMNDGDDGAFCLLPHSLPARSGLCQPAQMLITSDGYHVFTINNIRVNSTKIVGEYRDTWGRGRVTGRYGAIGHWDLLQWLQCIRFDCSCET